MNTTLKDWVIIISAIVIMALTLKLGCSSPFPNLEVQPQIQNIIKSDTVWSRDTLVKFKSIIKPIYDTIYRVEEDFDGIDLDTLFYVREYNDSLSDTNLTVYSKVKVIGILNKLDLSYKLKPKPSLITNYITTIITNVKIQPSKVSIIAGLELGGNKSSFNLSPYLCINLKKSSVSYRYGVINNTHSIGIGYKIFNSKK